MQTAPRPLRLGCTPAPRLLYTAVLAALAGTTTAAVLEEVVVTAQKREQNISDVGIAVTAFTGEQMKQLGFLTTSDLVAQTPGLNDVSPSGDGNNASFSLRGVGLNDFSENNESPTAVYVDQVYQATLAGLNFQLFDIERSEVLKGPQGTLYGRNTTGGLVHFITKRPTATPEAYGEVTVGEYDQVRFEGALSGPLTQALAGRVSFVYHDHDGYRHSRTPGVDDTPTTDTWGSRLQLLFTPNERIDALLSLHYATADQLATTYTHSSTTYAPDGVTEVLLPANAVNPVCAGVAGLTGPGQDCFGYRESGDVYTTDNDREPFLQLDTAGATFTLDWDFGAFTLTSISAYEYVNKFAGEDTDSGPVPALDVDFPVDSDQWSQELRLAGTLDRSRWTAGFYYFYRDMESGSRTDASGIGLVNDNTIDSDLTQSWALFGQYEYDFTPQWTGIAGLRFTHEDREFEMVATDDLGNTPLFLGLTPAPVPGFVIFDFRKAAVGSLTEQQLDDLSFRVELDWRPNDDWLVYASVARGTKGPGFNFAIDGTGIIGSSTVAQIPFGEETLTAWELGFKADLFGGSSRLNAAVFYYDYADYQAFSFEGITNLISNKDAEVLGFDAEFTTNPWQGWEFLFGVSALDTTVKDITSTNFFTGVPITRDREMVVAPDLEFNGLGRYEWPLFGGMMAVQGDFHYVGEQFFDIANNPIAAEDPYVIGNARLTYTSGDERWQAALWVKNLADAEHRVFAIPVTSLGFTENMYGRPRWIGATVSYKWD